MRVANGVEPPTARFELMQVIANGQSLSVGQVMTTCLSTTQPYQNVKLFDASGSYLLSAPKASTLSLIPLVAPLRTEAIIFELYPGNILGETVEVSMANEMTRLAARAGIPRFRVHGTCTGITGAQYVYICKGGIWTSYAAGIFECQALASGSANGGLAKSTGANSFGVGYSLFTHGESDASLGIAPGVYCQDIVNMQANYDADCRAITGQTSSIPMIFSQQNSCPLSFAQNNVTALDQLAAFVALPRLLLCSGPKYQYTYNPADRVHLLDYRPLGEKSAQVAIANELYLAGRGPGWSPLYPTSVVRVGTTITITFNVPVGDYSVSPAQPYKSLGPLVFDVTRSAPHQVGSPFAMWAAGNGLEYGDTPLTLSLATGVGVSPIVYTCASTANLITGQKLAIYGQAIVSSPASRGVFTITVINSTQFSLNGTIGNESNVGGVAFAFAPIGITSAVIVGNTVVMQVARAPITGGFVGNAHHSDVDYTSFTGGFPDGRCSLLRDSDPYVANGPLGSNFTNYNWSCEFQMTVS